VVSPCTRRSDTACILPRYHGHWVPRSYRTRSPCCTVTSGGSPSGSQGLLVVWWGLPSLSQEREGRRDGACRGEVSGDGSGSYASTSSTSSSLSRCRWYWWQRAARHTRQHYRRGGGCSRHVSAWRWCWRQAAHVGIIVVVEVPVVLVAAVAARHARIGP
jgi:hypothetical protein